MSYKKKAFLLSLAGWLIRILIMFSFNNPFKITIIRTLCGKHCSSLIVLYMAIHLGYIGFKITLKMVVFHPYIP